MFYREAVNPARISATTEMILTLIRNLLEHILYWDTRADASRFHQSGEINHLPIGDP